MLQVKRIGLPNPSTRTPATRSRMRCAMGFAAAASALLQDNDEFFAAVAADDVRLPYSA